MKRVGIIALVVVFSLFAVAHLIYDFVSSDGVRYFSERPLRFLLVALIGVAGGLFAFGFSALSRRLQRRIKLVVLGSGGGLVMLAGGYFSFQVANLPKLLDPTFPRHTPWLLVLGTIGVASLLWVEFYQVLRRREHVA